MKKKPWYKSYTLVINGLVAIVAGLVEWLPMVQEMLPTLQDSELTMPAMAISLVNIGLRFKTKNAVTMKEKSNQ